MVATVEKYHFINFSNAPLPAAHAKKTREVREAYLQYQLDSTQPDTFANWVFDLQKEKSQLATNAEYQIALAALTEKMKQGDKRAEQELTQHRVKFALFDEAEIFMQRVQKAYDTAKKNQDATAMFELEQALGRVKRVLIDYPSAPDAEDIDYARNVVIYNARVAEYNQNLEEIAQLAQQLAKHPSPLIRNVGISLMVIGGLAVVGFILLVSIPSFGMPFVAALSSLGLLGTSITVSSGLGLGAASAGAVVVGTGGGVVLAGIGAGMTFYKSHKNRAAHSLTHFAHNDKALKPIQIAKTTDMSLSKRDYDKTKDIKNAFRLLFKSDQPDAPAVMKNTKVHDLLLERLLLRIERGDKSHEIGLDQLNFAKYRFAQTKRYDILLEDLARISGVLIFKLKLNANTDTSALSVHKAKTWEIDEPYDFGAETAPKLKFIEKDMKMGEERYRFVLVDAPDPYKALGLEQPTQDDLKLAEAYVKREANARKCGTYSEGRYGLFNAGITESDDDDDSEQNSLRNKI